MIDLGAPEKRRRVYFNCTISNLSVDLFITVLWFVSVAGAALLTGLALYLLCRIAALLTAVFTPDRNFAPLVRNSYIIAAVLFCFDGYLVSEFGYLTHYWEAPGIWGAPGKQTTIWGTLELVLPAVGLITGLIFNATLVRLFPAFVKQCLVTLMAVSLALLAVTAHLWWRNFVETMG